MKRKDTLIVFTGGGSGGHVFPGIAVMQKLVKKIESNIKKYSITWIGSKFGIERKICSSYDISYHAIQTGKLRRYLSFQNFIDIFRVIVGVFQAIWYFLIKKPALVFSKGGFVTVPVVIAAAFTRVPVIIHESDYDPGLATKIASRFAQVICIPNEESKQFFRKKSNQHLVTTGNPIRTDIFQGSKEQGLAFLGKETNEPVIFVVGGSLGASQLNHLLELILPELLDRAYVVHQRGKQKALPIKHKNYQSQEFYSQEYAHLLKTADIVISRAGAGSLWEIACTQKASILVPLSSGSRGDQLRNAQFFAKENAAINLGPDPSVDEFKDQVLNLLTNPDKIRELERNITGLVKINASDTISDLIIKQLP
jgi:UDP-N-acetylglucosamine--N-acetylmuramyl-(pentapeptide) pyrophosphoryl-undecaprenol N-acetylglucosamine transferase